MATGGRAAGGSEAPDFSCVGPSPGFTRPFWTLALEGQMPCCCVCPQEPGGTGRCPAVAWMWDWHGAHLPPGRQDGHLLCWKLVGAAVRDAVGTREAERPQGEKVPT